MSSKGKLIETFCKLNLCEEFNQLPNDFENSMVLDTPEAYALLAERITEEKNEFEFKKLELEKQSKLEEIKIQSEFAFRTEIERLQVNERISRYKLDSSYRKFLLFKNLSVTLIMVLGILGIFFIIF